MTLVTSVVSIHFTFSDNSLQLSHVYFCADIESVTSAMKIVNGYKMKGRPMIVQYGKQPVKMKMCSLTQVFYMLKHMPQKNIPGLYQLAPSMDKSRSKGVMK